MDVDLSRFSPEDVSKARSWPKVSLVYVFPLYNILMSLSDAQEVMSATQWVSEWGALIDLTDVTLVSDDNLRTLIMRMHCNDDDDDGSW